MEKRKYKVEVYDYETNELKGTSKADELEVLRKYYAYQKGIARDNPVRCVAKTEAYTKEEEDGTITQLTLVLEPIDIPKKKIVYTIIK